MVIDRIALVLVIIGALNWLCVGIFQFDFVAWICSGAATTWARIIYSIVGIAGLWCISLLFRKRVSE
ncbi:MAG: DUF378 domain-containing protein [Selenomonadales bacterium]|nr:DUF378 domain-containing protein [Clostridiales bacterium]PWL96057.1 MAG: DUF378 domain-containing protein [Selenomonadales bacterium]